jgi:hypothetical protein
LRIPVTVTFFSSRASSPFAPICILAERQALRVRAIASMDFHPRLC